MDTTGQRTDSGGGQDPLSLNGLVMLEIEVMLPPKINLSRVRPQENQKRGNATALSTLRAGGGAGMGGNRAQLACATHSLRGSEYRPLK
jgi:hypothetical protein